MSQAEAPIPVRVAVAASSEVAIPAALAAMTATVGCPNFLLRDPSLPPLAAQSAVALMREALACAPGALAKPLSGTGWTSRPVPAGASRFASVMLPAWANEASVALIVRAPGADGRPTSPFELLARQAPVRQRLAARLAPRPRQALAELASVWRIALVLVVGRVESSRLVIATPNLVSAELAWLALRPSLVPNVAPWEDAGVQGAAALGLPPLTPTHLRLIAATPEAASVVATLAPRLGV